MDPLVAVFPSGVLSAILQDQMAVRQGEVGHAGRHIFICHQDEQMHVNLWLPLVAWPIAGREHGFLKMLLKTLHEFSSLGVRTDMKRGLWRASLVHVLDVLPFVVFTYGVLNTALAMSEGLRAGTMRAARTAAFAS